MLSVTNVFLGPYFEFGSVFQDNMVLQREPQSAKVWGFGQLGYEVTLQLEEESYTVPVEEHMDEYIWMVNLPPHPAGGPHTIIATQNAVPEDNPDSLTIELQNVLFGDVWLCSGQSNMEYTMPNVSQI